MRGEAGVRRRRPAGGGLFVLVVGPDGSGKSTLSRRLIEETQTRFRNPVHMHWRPGLLPRAGSLVGVKGGEPSDPHAQEPHGLLLSLALLTYYWIDFFLGTWIRIWPVRARGDLVVMERGWLDIAVDPRRYHLAVPSKLVELLGRFLPAPDLVVILAADPHMLSRRKAELPPAELHRQMRRWREVSFPRRTVRLPLDASQSPESLVDQVAREILPV
jgi:thymidylate kinase